MNVVENWTDLLKGTLENNHREETFWLHTIKIYFISFCTVTQLPIKCFAIGKQDNTLKKCSKKWCLWVYTSVLRMHLYYAIPVSLCYCTNFHRKKLVKKLSVGLVMVHHIPPLEKANKQGNTITHLQSHSFEFNSYYGMGFFF